MTSRLALLMSLLLAGCGNVRLEDRTTPPLFPADALQLVADVPYPPGNIAVAPDGRIFFTFHPNGAPTIKLAELVKGKPIPYPDLSFQDAERARPWLDSPLAVRIDRQNRLWVLDYARYGRGQPRLLAFDLTTNAVVHQYDFPSDVAGFLSMVNDFAVDPAGQHIYIAEASPIRQRPALIVYDVKARKARRVLDRDPSVVAGNYVTVTPERAIKVLGFPIRIGVDSITLDTKGEWLYYAPFTGDTLYRIRTRDLNDESLAAGLSAKVEGFAPKTISDGLSRDSEDRIYITDPEHAAILVVGPDRKLWTLLKDTKCRWPDGLSFGADGWLYVTCSALQHVMFQTTAHMKAHAPFQIYRFRPGPASIAGQ